MKLIYKLTLRIIVAAALFVGLCTLFTNSKTAADALPNNCPGGSDTSLPSVAYGPSGGVIWGNDSDGMGSGNLASLVLHARDVSGNLLNPHFTLSSALPAGFDQKQIYNWDWSGNSGVGTGGSVSNSDNAPGNASDFKLGATMHNGPTAKVQCNGWMVVGPGYSGHVGNGWVLNCHEQGPYTSFTLSNIENPGGAPGHWELLDLNGAVKDSNISATPYTFTVNNGYNSRYTLVWHPVKWSLSGDSTVDGQHGTVPVKVGSTHTFQHKVTNNGPDPASYTWSVQGSVPGGKPANVANGVSPGGINPNTADDKFIIPSGTIGNTYCEHIQYSYPTGPTDGGIGSSSAACVHVVSNTTPPTNSGSCSQITEYNYGNYSYTSPGGNQITGRPTRTEVITSNPGAINNDTGGSIDAFAPGKDGSTDKNPKTWNITATSASFTYYTVRWYQQTNGNWSYIDNNGNPSSSPSQNAHTISNCYHASCGTPTAIDGQGPGGTIVANQPFRLLVPVTNDNGDPNAETIPESAGGYRFSLTGTGGEHDTGFSLNIGETETATIGLNAPSGVQYMTLNYYPDLYGSGSIGNGCSITIPVYQEFNIQPYANAPTGDAENPTAVTYTTGGYLTYGPSVAANTYGSLTRQSNGVCPSGVVDNYGNTPTYGNVPQTRTYGNSCINAGDLFCSHVTISPAHGWHGPDGGNIGTNDASADSSSCLKTVNRPYVHFTGNDVTAGGGFGQSCTATLPGAIQAYSDASSGSGSQFGAQAFSVISGLSSASLRSASPTAPSGLSFANTAGLRGSPPDNITGGSLGGASNLCMPDYFSDKPSTLSTPSTAVTATAGSGAGQQYFKPAGGTLTLSGGTIANATNQTIFVEGNVTITGDIKYSTAARGSVKDIPSFYLVVKGGNIHISPNVQQLDGVYVAQPSSTPSQAASTGIINTCWVSNDVNTIYNQCKNQLVVNGAFAANKVLLTRSYSSLRYSQSKEHNLGGFASHSCGHAGTDIPSTGPLSAPDCAAEIFNFSPELYMSQPALNARYGASTDKYDAITSLPPVL